MKKVRPTLGAADEYLLAHNEIKMLRMGIGMTASEAARFISRSTPRQWNRYEEGSRNMPDKVARKLLEAVDQFKRLKLKAMQSKPEHLNPPDSACSSLHDLLYRQAVTLAYIDRLDQRVAA